MLSSFFYYMFIYKTALQISLMIDDCEFAKFIGLSSKLLHFNTSEASMTPLFKVSHARAQATHSIFQSPQITLDETFSILYTLQFLYSFLFTHTFFYYHLYAENSPNLTSSPTPLSIFKFTFLKALTAMVQNPQLNVSHSTPLWDPPTNCPLSITLH